MMADTSFQCAAFTGQKDVQIISSPMPQSVAGEVLVKVIHTALCGSDNRLWRDGAEQIPGHEIFGVVEQAGHPRHGARVCVYIPVYCGRCNACSNGHTQSCQTQSVLVGWNRDGGFAEYVQVPEQCLLPVPDKVHDRIAPLLLDTIGTSAHAVRNVQRWLGKLSAKRILITGAGPIGMGVLLALQDAGCNNVVVSDPVPERRRFAEQLAQQTAVLVHDPAGPAELPEDAGNPLFDAIFECSGAHAARDLAISAISPGGVVVLIGENNQPWKVNEGPVFRRKDFILLRSFYFQVAEHSDNIDLLMRNVEAYEKIADREITLEQLPQEYKDFVAGLSMKPLLTFR